MKIYSFEKGLLEWFKKNERKGLPWRRKRISAYEVWVSEVMLQQTQVSRVVIYYENFLKRFPSVEELAKASWEEFLPFYQGLGYYRRGKNMLETAKKIVREYGGQFPKTKKELMTLQGVGAYTANAILSFGYSKDSLAWDTNLQKVFGRFFFGNKSEKFDEKNFDEKIKAEKKIFNGAVMDFANLVCKKEPLCDSCPLKKQCKFFISNGKLELKQKKELKNSFRIETARAYVFLHAEHKMYYSSNTKKYKPFILPIGKVRREHIKEYFLNKYGLTLSVRPPHKRGYIVGRPIIFVNAQILLGVPVFSVFDRQRVHDMMALISFDS